MRVKILIIDGKAIAENILTEIKTEIQELKKNKIFCGLAVVLVGNNQASKIYVNNKQKTCEKLGIFSEIHNLPSNLTQEKLITLIKSLNQNRKISGILVQLPLPSHIDEKIIAETILPDKDVDVFNPANIGRVSIGNANIWPCTPAGVIEILKRQKIEIAGRHIVVVGRSNIVGKPLAMMFLNENATVTICHSKTCNLAEITKLADILVAAVGKPKFITEKMLKENSVVIDVGMNRDENGKLCGDVDFENVKSKVLNITPVPGGVGPMTIAMLMKNTLELAKLHKIDFE